MGKYQLIHVVMTVRNTFIFGRKDCQVDQSQLVRVSRGGQKDTFRCQLQSISHLNTEAMLVYEQKWKTFAFYSIYLHLCEYNLYIVCRILQPAMNIKQYLLLGQEHQAISLAAAPFPLKLGSLQLFVPCIVYNKSDLRIE